MARTHSRRWSASDGTEWTVEWNPSVELDTPAVRRAREGLFFRSGSEVHKTPAPYGSDLDDLSVRDLQGLLDQARTGDGARDPSRDAFAAAERDPSRESPAFGERDDEG